MLGRSNIIMRLLNIHDVNIKHIDKENKTALMWAKINNMNDVQQKIISLDK